MAEDEVKGGGNPVPTNLLAFVRSIGRTETGFSEKEAYSEAYNVTDPKDTKHYNKNVAAEGIKAADYGYYQMNRKDADEAVSKYGMKPEVAQHLYGGPDKKSTLDQQTYATAEYIQKRWPEQTKKLIENNDFEGIRSATKGMWSGLKPEPLGHPVEARKEFSNVRDAARVSAAAAAVGGGDPKLSDGKLKPADTFIDKNLYRGQLDQKTNINNKKDEPDPKANPKGSTDKRVSNETTDKQKYAQLSDTEKLQRRGIVSGPNPANPYFNSTEFEYAVITDSGAGDPTKQQRAKISPQSLAGIDPQSMPFAKSHIQHSQEAPTWNTPHTYKNGNVVKVRKVGDEWEIVGNPGTINM